MRAPYRLSGALLTVFSGLAFGALGMTGVFAAVVFPAMKGLNPSLPEYAAYSGAHWSLAAGILAERVFGIGFAIAGASLALCVASVVGLGLWRPAGGRPPVGRAGLLLLTLALFLAHATWLQPRMDAAVGEYRSAAIAGDSESAARAKQRFDGMHPFASRLLAGSALSALALLVASAWAAGAVPSATTAQGDRA
jgi:hypothetical protein